MIRPTKCVFLLAGLLLSTSATAQVTPSPAAQRLRTLIATLDTADVDDRPQIYRYVRANYAPDYRERFPIDRHVDFLMGLVDQPNGLILHDIREATTTQATALIHLPLTDEWLTFPLWVEETSPHRITSIGLRLADAPPDATPSTPLTRDEAVQQLNNYLHRLTDADAFSGAVLLAHDGRPLYARAFGDANKDFQAPNHIDTKFNLGSMNKMFTAVVITQLVEQGRLAFDDPLSDYLPDFPTPEAAQKIQIRHLLTHTSGLGSYFNEAFMQGARSRFRTVDDFMQLARGDSLRFEPGTEWSYSNTGFLVLGKVIEIVTDQSYVDYAREHIYQPAGMHSSGSFELDHVNPNLAVGYDKQYTNDGVRYRNNLFEHVIKGGPAGGGYSTVGDLLRFAQSLQDGTLVGSAYVDTLLTPKPGLNSPDYGYGFGIGGPEDRRVGHSGGFPGISSNLDIFRGRGYVVVVLSNYSRASGPVVRKMRELIARVE